MRGVCRRRACAFILAWTLGGCEETLPGELGACEGAPVEGRCLSETELEICVVRTEGGRGLARVTETCPTDTHCVELDDDTVRAPMGGWVEIGRGSRRERE